MAQMKESWWDTLKRLKDECVTIMADIKENAAGIAQNAADIAAERAKQPLRYKGNVATVSALPQEGNEVGDMWNVTSTENNYVWNGESWDPMAGVLNLPEASTIVSGVSKLGTDLTVSNGAAVGKSSGGQLFAVPASTSRVGAVKIAEDENDEGTTSVLTASKSKELLEAKADKTSLEGYATAKDIADRYTKAEIDGVDTGAEVMKRLAEDEKYLREYEEFAGIKLPPEFWEAYFEAIKEWQKDPTLKVWGEEEKEKYKGKPRIKPLIDLSVTDTKMFLAENKEFRASAVYFPNLTIGESLLRSSKNMGGHVIAPNVKSAKWILNGVIGVKYAYFPNIAYGLSFAVGSGIEKAYIPNIINASYAFYMCGKYNHYTKINNAINCDSLIEGGSSFNNVFEMGSCSTAKNAFKNTRLDSSNIAKILDFLPTWTDGKSHVITFTRSPGIASTATEETFGGVENCPTFDNDDESQTLRTAYASAIMRGWTVEL